MKRPLLFSLLFTLACGEPPPVEPPGPGPRDAGIDSGTPNPPAGHVRFVVLGDGGTGEQTQKNVARAMDTICDRDGCDFALYLGDNIYNTGVESVDDEQFITKFETPYANLDFPFYVVLGNHDYGGEGVLILNQDRIPHQVAYTEQSAKWTMPEEYYSVVRGNVTLIGLDTTGLYLNFGRATQQAWIDQQVDAATTPWKIAFGHHPYVSNGKHGNAGTYEGIPFNGQAIQRVFEESICGQVDAYFCGHDHNRQWLGERCGTLFAVSGAAAKLDELPGRGNETEFEDATKAGFLWVDIVGDLMKVRFYDEDGFMGFERQVTRPSAN